MDHYYNYNDFDPVYDQPYGAGADVLSPDMQPMQAPFMPIGGLAKNIKARNKLLALAVKRGYVPKSKRRKRSPLQVLIDALSTFQYASANIAENLSGFGPEKPGFVPAMKAAGEGLKAGVGLSKRRGDYTNLFRKMIANKAKEKGWEGISKKGYFQLGKVIDKKTGAKWERTFPGLRQKFIKAADFMADYHVTGIGFAANVLLDPLSYISIGTGKAGKLAAKGLKTGSKLIAASGDDAFKAGSKYLVNLAAKGGDDALKVGSNLAAETALFDVAKKGLGDFKLLKGLKDEALIKAFQADNWAKPIKKFVTRYSDDLYRIAKADKGGIKFVPPQKVKFPGAHGVEKWHLPFAAEQPFTKGYTLPGTGGWGKRLGITQAIKTAVMPVTGPFGQQPQVKLWESMVDQVKHNPEGIISRFFVKPTAGAKKFVPDELLKAADDVMRKPIVTKTLKFANKKLFELRAQPTLQNTYEFVVNNPDMLKLRQAFIDFGDTTLHGKKMHIAKSWNLKRKAANEYLQNMAAGIKNAAWRVGDPENVASLSREDILKNLHTYMSKYDDVWPDVVRWAGEGKHLPGRGIQDIGTGLKLDKTMVGQWVDRTMDAVNAVYQLPKGFADGLKRYHLRGIEDKHEINTIADIFRDTMKKAGLKTDKEYLEFLRHIESGGAVPLPKDTPAMQAAVVNWRHIFSDNPFLQREMEKGIFHPVKDYVTHAYTKMGRLPPNAAKGGLTVAADEWVKNYQHYIHHLREAGEQFPGKAPQLNKIIDEISKIGLDGRPMIPDGFAYARKVKSLDEAISLGWSPIVKPDELIKIRLNAAADLVRQDDMLNALKNSKDLTISLPESFKHIPDELIKAPPGYVLGNDLRIPALKNLFVEEKTARYLVKHFLPKQELHPLMQLMHKTLTQIKVLYTMWNPQFHTRNMVGNFINNWFGNVNSVTPYIESLNVLRHAEDPAKLMKMVIDVPGGKLSGLDVLQQMKTSGVFGGFMAHEAIGMTTPGFVSGVKGVWGKIKKPFEVTGRFIEDWGRAAHFVDKVKKGFTYEDAIKSVNKYLFDYKNVSDFDKSVKEIIPFWMWMKNNVPLQIEMLARKPGKFAYMPKLQALLSGGSRQALQNREMVKSDWLKESYHAQLPEEMTRQWGFSKPVIFKMGVPQEDITRLMDVKDIYGSLTPLLKIPAELTFNKNLFFGSDIVPPGLLHDPKLQRVKADPLLARTLGIIPGNPFNVLKTSDSYGKDRWEMDARAHHVIRSTLRPINEIGRGLDPETNAIVRLVNYMGPVKAYEYDIERQIYFDVLEEKKRLRAILQKLKGEQMRGGIGRGTGV